MALNEEDKSGKPAKPPSPVPEKRGGWLSRIAPGVRRLVGSKRDTPDNLWVKDPDTGEMIFRKDLEAALWVTPSGRHMRIAPDLRFAYTFDDGKFEKLATPKPPDDPLKFSDLKPYPELLATARKTTGEHDVMTVAVGRITGIETVVAVMNFAFRGGSMGLAVGEAFIFAAEEAVRRQAPMVVFTASGGARQQEGTLALMQMARTTIAVQFLKAQTLPYVVVMTDPTTAGVLASYAMLGDVQLAEPGALIGFAGRRVIEETIRETLPPGFQTAEFLVDRGGLDAVVPRGQMRETLGRILSTLLMGRARRHAA
jgi:acetyl-CoA carboxylase carboxyl transferase subunit beta